MLQSIKVWWTKERIDRFEKETSQDICPTNGEAVLWLIFNCIIGGLILFVVSLTK